MKDYIEVSEKTCCEVHNCICVKEVDGKTYCRGCGDVQLVEWYQKNRSDIPIDLSNVFIVWSCKTLQNYKCLASTDISGDGIYAEYTYNGDKQELYEDVYGKITNTCHTEE